MYEVLLTVHILAVAVWVGGAITLHLLVSRLRAAGPAQLLTVLQGST